MVVVSELMVVAGPRDEVRAFGERDVSPLVGSVQGVAFQGECVEVAGLDLGAAHGEGGNVGRCRTSK